MELSLVPVLVLLAGTYGGTVSGQLLGGEVTSIEQYPSLVAVENFNPFTEVWTHSCAGNILTARWIVSAAHCFDGLLFAPERRRIRAGSSLRNTGGQVSQVLTVHNHPEYSLQGFNADITVVRLETALEYNPVIQQGNVVIAGFQLPDASIVKHAGWGATSQGAARTEVIHEVTVESVNEAFCRELYSGLQEVTDNMICAGIVEEGSLDTCQGDAGGPLYFYDANDQQILVGVVSFGNGCANNTYPIVSTKVSSYTNWILQTVQ